MKRMRILAAVVAMAVVAAAEEPAAPVTGMKVSLGEVEGRKAFLLVASTTWKDGERADLVLYYVRRYKLPPGLVEPGQPDFEEELIDIAKSSATAQGGKFAAAMGASDQEPWPGLYRIVASWPDAASTADDGMSHAQGEVQVGNAKDLAVMRARIDREVYEDFAQIGKVMDELKDRWSKLGKDADVTWGAFRGAADRRIAGVKQRNGLRRSFEVYWMESRGKQRVDWTLQKVCPLLDAAAQHLGKAKADRPDPKELDLAIAEAEDDYQHYLDFMGFGRIVDADKVDAALHKECEIADEIKAWKAKAAADKAAWAEAAFDLRSRLMESAMNLSGELPEAYFARAENVQKVALRMLDHVGDVAAGKKPAEEWDDLQAKLDAAVKELQVSVPRLKD